MTQVRHVLIALATTLAIPAIAHAEAPPATPAFAADAVPDAVLAEQRGGQSPFAILTVRNAARMLEAQSFSDWRQSGTIARVTMDVWWAQTGGELIAANVRATLP